eukprot:scaffold214603_cov18-Tisochrysis_lutea.AAC.1
MKERRRLNVQTRPYPMEAQTESCQLVHAAIKISAVWWCRVIDGTGGFWTSGTILRNLLVNERAVRYCNMY